MIVSGDGDFHCLIEYLLSQEKLEKLIIPNKYNFSSLLRKFSDKIWCLNKEKDKLQSIKKEVQSQKTWKCTSEPKEV